MSDVVATDDRTDDDDAEEVAPALQAANAGLLEALRTREEPRPGEYPLEISEMDFSGADLQGVNLAGAELVGCDFSRANLAGARLAGATINDTSFAGARFVGASFQGADVLNTDFEGADLQDADFRSAMLELVDFRDANLNGVVFDSGAAGANFLDAANVQGMDIAEIDDDDMDPRERLTLHERGAHAHHGVRCPRCEQWDGPERGLDPTCSKCDGIGFVEEAPAAPRQQDPIDCPWCGGSGQISYSMSSASCLVCDGEGEVGTWVIDRNQFDDNVSGEIYEYESEIEFPGMGFRDVDFSHCWYAGGHIEDVDFTACSFAETNFAAARLVNVRFTGCNLQGAVFAGGTVEDVSFADCVLTGSDWSDAGFTAVHADAKQFADAMIAPELLAEMQPGNHARAKS
ncbi:MAG: pentapeptide repeat-containing protein [Thermomicrobiales bacterium]